jgi:TolA-binding protein
VPGVKITRKEIKRDEFATTIGTLTTVVEQHARSLLIATGAVVVLAAAVAGGLWYSHSRDQQARLKLAAIYRAAVGSVAEEGAASARYATRREKYEDIVRLAGIVLTEHPSSSSAKWAAYWKAEGQKQLGDFAGALETLAPLVASTQDEFLACSSRMLQARVQEAKGDLAAAVETYATLAASAPATFPAEMALMNQARLLEAQGKVEEARESYRRVTQEYPESPYAREASQHLAPGRG